MTEYLHQKEARKTSLMNEDAAYIELPAPLVPVIQNIVVEPLREGVIIPTYSSEGDSGADLYAPEDIILVPGSNNLIKLGFAMELPKHPFHDYGFRWEAQVRPRSGVSLKTDLTIPNSPGTIDNFYIDEVGVIVRNTYKDDLELNFNDVTADEEADGLNEEPGVEITLDPITVDHVYSIKGDTIEGIEGGPFPNGTYIIRKGERFAQLVFNQVYRPLEGFVVGTVNRERTRGGGFGSSGTK